MVDFINVKIKSKLIQNNVRIVICQKKLGNLIGDSEKDLIADFAPNFVCLPELFFINNKIKNYDKASKLEKEIKYYLLKLSVELNTAIIGGTLIHKEQKGLVSRCYICTKGHRIGYYDKINLTDKEKLAGFIEGNTQFCIIIDNVRFTVLICNDIFCESLFINAKKVKCQIIFMPTGSPYKPKESVADKFKRDNDLYVARSKISKCIIVKVCGVGEIFGNKLQGRSLIADCDGLKWRVQPEEELKECIALVEIKKD